MSSQCIARATEFLLIQRGDKDKLIDYCLEVVNFNTEYQTYLREVNKLPIYEALTIEDFKTLCGKQPIEKPYFLPGIKGVPSDSKYTTGSVLYVLKNSTDAMDALKKSIYLGGDVDSVASITTGINAGLSGLESIPKFMINNIEGKEYLKSIASKFKAKIG